MTVLSTPSTHDGHRTDPDADHRAADLIAALTELPVGHPSRAAAREQAIQAWLPMAHRLAHRYAGRGEPVDDLFQTATSADGDLAVGDTLGGDDHGYELAELRLVLGPALAALDERQRRILTMRFFGNHTQSQIAAEIGVSQMHISRLLTKALAQLRTHLDGHID